MKKVFISHPYASDPIGNREKVDKICRDLLKNNICIPVSPLHMFGYMDNDDHRKEVLEVCFRVISVCDEVWVYGCSSGCNQEIRIAEQLGKPVKELYDTDKYPPDPGSGPTFMETSSSFLNDEYKQKLAIASRKLSKALDNFFRSGSDVFK